MKGPAGGSPLVWLSGSTSSVLRCSSSARLPASKKAPSSSIPVPDRDSRVRSPRPGSQLRRPAQSPTRSSAARTTSSTTSPGIDIAKTHAMPGERGGAAVSSRRPGRAGSVADVVGDLGEYGGVGEEPDVVLAGDDVVARAAQRCAGVGDDHAVAGGVPGGVAGGARRLVTGGDLRGERGAGVHLLAGDEHEAGTGGGRPVVGARDRGEAGDVGVAAQDLQVVLADEPAHGVVDDGDLAGAGARLDLVDVGGEP